MKNSTLHQIHARYEKNFFKNCLFQDGLQIYCCFFIGTISFHLFSKNDFIKIKNSIFSPKYMKYGNKKQNCLFQTDIKAFA